MFRLAVRSTSGGDRLSKQCSQRSPRPSIGAQTPGTSRHSAERPEWQREADGSGKANFSAVEAYALHRERLASHVDDFDPRVAKRLLLGANILAADYVDLLQLRKALIASANVTTARFDAVLAPTVPIIAPLICDMETSEEFFLRMNGLLLRNCAPFNVLDRPCWSLPCHTQGEAPVGLMVVGETMGDIRLQSIGLAIEQHAHVKLSRFAFARVINIFSNQHFVYFFALWASLGCYQLHPDDGF